MRTLATPLIAAIQLWFVLSLIFASWIPLGWLFIKNAGEDTHEVGDWVRFGPTGGFVLAWAVRRKVGMSLLLSTAAVMPTVVFWEW